MADSTPDEIAAKSFRSTFRGFDPSEVRAYLQTLARSIDELVTERDQMASKLGSFSERDLKSEFEAVGREVSEVLEAARRAAEQMRERASVDATRWRSEALAEAEAEIRRGRADAEALRGDAWATADELLKQSIAEAERINASSEQERLRLVGEAEREAHRVVSAGRREAEDLVRNAKMEADRLTIAAQTAHDEMIERATRTSDAAQERVRALEIRREELRTELEAIRHAIATAEGELEERRSALSLSPPSAPRPEPVTEAGSTPEEPDEEWSPGETVRVVRPGGPAPGVTQSTESLVDTPEITVLSADELLARSSVDGEPAEGEDAAEDAEVAVDEIAEQAGEVQAEEPAPAPVDAEEPAAPAHDEAAVTEPSDEAERHAEEDAPAVEEPEPSIAPPGPEPEAEGHDVEDLFARLRTPTSPPPAGEEAAAEAPAEPVREDVEPPGASQPGPAPDFDGDPFEMREEALLPISNRALRNIKRQLTEAQNEALEALRLSDGEWEPDGPELGSRLRPDLVVLSAESFSAGHASAMEMTGERLKRPATPKTEPEHPWVADLLRDLNHVLAEGRRQGQGTRQLGASASRVFRSWRTDEAERRVSELASAGYHDGLIETLRSGDHGVRWVISGRGCSTCRASAESPADEWESPPPAHPGCECTVVVG